MVTRTDYNSKEERAAFSVLMELIRLLGEYRDNINLALALYSFPSRQARDRDARKWLKRKTRAKKLKSIFRPFLT